MTVPPLNHHHNEQHSHHHHHNQHHVGSNNTTPHSNTSTSSSGGTPTIANTWTDETAPLLSTSNSSTHSHANKGKRRDSSSSNKNKKGGGSGKSTPKHGSSNDLASNNSAHALDTASPTRRNFAHPLLMLKTWGSRTWLPGPWDVRDVPIGCVQTAMQVAGVGHGGHAIHNHTFHNAQPQADTTQRVQEYRSWRRRLFLVLTEPDTSLCSALFFWLLMLGIIVMNILMMLQTMRAFQYTPDDCTFCGGTKQYLFEEDGTIGMVVNDDVVRNDQEATTPDCVCAPTPYPWTDKVLQYLIYLFTAEWILRVLCYAPAPHERATGTWGKLEQFFNYLFSWPMVLDFWATFPYYMEFANFDSNGLMSLRLLRLFRVFQLVRLGSYNVTFTALLTVLQSATAHLQILCMMLVFGAALFGSMIFWLEKGTWQYYEPTQSYEFVRVNEQQQMEISPFSSIPETFYWFMVTATTVGYGDVYPVTNPGRWVGVMAMMLSLLVIAFPVSVFSDLWSKELERVGAVRNLEALSSDSDSGSEGEVAGDNDDDGDLDGDKNTTEATQLLVPSGQDMTDSTYDLNDILAAANDDKRPPPIQTNTWNYGYQHQPQVLAAAKGQQQPVGHHHHHHHRHSVALPDDPNELVVMSKEDVLDLARHSQSICDSQKQMQLILRKYKLTM